MPRRARMALIGAAAGVLLLLATWVVAHYVGPVKRADVSILSGFAELHRPRLDRITSWIADLCDPHQYVALACVPVLVALLRGRPRVAVTLGIILLGANETTQLLKPVLAAPRDPVSWSPLGDATWPSGHATAAMSLALCAVIAAPARRRPMVATAMSSFAIAVCYSFLELGWHYPSDVLGGFLVATTWTLLGVAGLSLYEARRPRPVPRIAPGGGRPAFSLREALAPAAVLLALAAALAGAVALARPHEVIEYARVHSAFVVGAAAIGALGISLASGLMLVLRRP
ncbi:MAG: phosphatase PAP2 family protein [Solirubrobacterales bacterium]|nr:phosphatase PAP2 family protein [Solirubrobacterales bacterium]